MAIFLLCGITKEVPALLRGSFSFRDQRGDDSIAE
jgi:hypothetical protein